MLGFLILLLSLVTYFHKRCRYVSIIIYLFFLIGTGGGFGLLTDSVMGVKNQDLALIYTIFIYMSGGSRLLKNVVRIKDKWFIWYKILLVFLLCIAMFSFFYYSFSPFQIIQGGRAFLLLLSLPIFFQVRPSEIQKILVFFFWLTVITSILYSLQIVAGRPLMPYDLEYEYDTSTGLIRLYNYPPLLRFFLIGCFVCPRFYPGNVNIYRSIFFIALICTLGRTFILTTIFAIILATIFMGKSTASVKAIAVIGLLLLPFGGIISNRFEDGNTGADISNTIKGGASNYNSGDGTMVYRLAWIYERYDYLKDRPLGEQIFGMGMISGSQPIVYKMYNFKLGLINEDGEIDQLGTPDTSYGNLLTKMGFGGEFIYLAFCVSLAMFFYKKRKTIPILTICAVELIVAFINAISSSGLSEPRNFAFYFLCLAILYQSDKTYELTNHKSKWILETYNLKTN